MQEGQGITASSDRAYHVEGSRLVAYDYDTGEVIRRDIPGGSTMEKLRAVLGSVPDPVKIVAKAESLTALWQAMSKGGPFQTVNESAGLALERHSSYPVVNSFVRMTFSQQGLVYSFLASSPRAHYHWTISYSHEAQKYKTPAEAVTVSAFHERAKPAHYDDKVARSLVRSLLKAEKELGPTRIHVQRDDGQTNIYWEAGQVRGASDAGRWAYDGTVLTVAADGSFYRGKATRADTLDYLAALTNGTDPMARDLLIKAAPFRDFFQPGADVRVVGKIKMADQPVTILSVKGTNLKSSLYVRNSDHLVVGIDSDNLDASGNTVMHEHATFSYTPLEAGTTSFTLKRQPGQTVRKLPKSAIKLPAAKIGG